MIKPKALKMGDAVGVVAPSDAVERAGMEESLEIIRSWGLKVKIGKHVYSKVGDFTAGTPEERQEDLREMINDCEVGVVWAASGGYAATEVLPVFDRETMARLKNDPKWFVGYSDVCLILNVLTSYKIASITGPSVWGLAEWDKDSQEMLRKMLWGEGVAGVGAEYGWRGEIEGVAEGRLVTSNLETLILSFGTRFDPLMYGSGPVVLTIEELDIDKSTLQRQIDVILGHKRAMRIAGIIVGRLVNIRELSYPEWGREVTSEGLIAKRVKMWGKGKIPLAFLADFGHAEWDYADIPEGANHKFVSLPNGINSRLTVTDKECKLEYLEAVCS
ncbi:LD-carboxypeptidase [Candidatus Amesbacteria bacterium]|nr:LD-carboxypeptidase [Candidatus Amesbacteria bacterium]